MKIVLKITILLMIVWTVACEASSVMPGFTLIHDKIEAFYPETEDLRRKETRIYNNFFIRRVNGDYYRFNENPSRYSYIDLSDQITVDRYSRDCNTSCYTTIKRANNLLVRYVSLSGFNRNAFQIDSLRVYNFGKEINHVDFNSNYVFGEQAFSSTLIAVDLGKIYYFDDLTIEINFSNPFPQNLRYNLDLYESWNFEADLYKFTRYYMELNAPREKERVLIKFADAIRFNNIGKELNYHEDELNNMFRLRYSMLTESQFRYYALDRISTGIYTEVPLNGHYHDLNDMRILYSYFLRNMDIQNNQSNQNNISNLVSARSRNTNDADVNLEEEIEDGDIEHYNGVLNASFSNDPSNLLFRNGDSDGNSDCPIICRFCLLLLIIMIIIMSIMIKKKR